MLRSTARRMSLCASTLMCSLGTSSPRPSIATPCLEDGALELRVLGACGALSTQSSDLGVVSVSSTKPRANSLFSIVQLMR